MSKMTYKTIAFLSEPGAGKTSLFATEIVFLHYSRGISHFITALKEVRQMSLRSIVDYHDYFGHAQKALFKDTIKINSG